MARSHQEISTFKLVPSWEQTYPHNVHSMDIFIIVHLGDDDIQENEDILMSPQVCQSQYLGYTYGHLMEYYGHLMEHRTEHIFSSRTLT